MRVSPDSGRFRGRTALLTGASRGLGLALAYQFASEGADLMLIARDAKRLARVGQYLTRRWQVGVQTIACDLSTADGLDGLLSRLKAERIDILVNNAAGSPVGYVEAATAEETARLIRLNLESPVRLTQLCVPGMIRRNFGRVLNVGSAGGRIGLPGLALYSATKAALHLFSEAVRREVAPYDIGITLLVPAVVAGRSARGEAAATAELYRTQPFEDFTPFRRLDVAAKGVNGLLARHAIVQVSDATLRRRLRFNSLWPAFVDRQFARIFQPRRRFQSSASTSTIFIAGASGFVGVALADALVRDGYRVRCLIRDHAKLARLPSDVDAVIGDVLDQTTMAAALEGIDTAFYLVHSMGEARFEERDRRAATAFHDAAVGARVKRIVYLGALGPDAAGSAHLRSRQTVQRILSAAPVRTTTFRAALIVGPGSTTLNMLTDVVRRLPVIPYSSLLETRIQPITLDDVIRYLVRSLVESGTEGRAFDIGGPEVMTYVDLLRRIDRLLRTRRLFVRFPFVALTPSAWLVSALTRAPRRTAQALFDSAGVELVCREDGIGSIISMATTSIDSALEQSLGVSVR